MKKPRLYAMTAEEHESQSQLDDQKAIKKIKYPKASPYRYFDSATKDCHFGSYAKS